MFIIKSDLAELENEKFDSVEACNAAEAEVLAARSAAEAEKEERDAELFAEKKMLSEKIEAAETALTQANEQYRDVLKKAADLRAELEEQIATMISEAQKICRKAESDKWSAVNEFTSKFGCYRKVYTGADAHEALNRILNDSIDLSLDRMVSDFIYHLI